MLFYHDPSICFDTFQMTLSVRCFTLVLPLFWLVFPAWGGRQLKSHLLFCGGLVDFCCIKFLCACFFYSRCVLFVPVYLSLYLSFPINIPLSSKEARVLAILVKEKKPLRCLTLHRVHAQCVRHLLSAEITLSIKWVILF